MLLKPKKLKYNKTRKGRIKGIEYKSNKIVFGSFGLKTLENGKITQYQIEAARKSIRRALQKQGSLWIRIFPDTPITEKPNQVRMGKGKGLVKYWVAKVKPGRILFELEHVSKEIIYEAFKKGSIKLPIKTRIIERIK